MKGSVKAETEDEKKCFQLLSDLDHVNYKVQGSVTSKKYMYNKIWSLVSYLGASSQFIAFAPADVKYPLGLYFADTNQEIIPEFRNKTECINLITNNPVAGTGFFKVIVETGVIWRNIWILWHSRATRVFSTTFAHTCVHQKFPQASGDL